MSSEQDEDGIIEPTNILKPWLSYAEWDKCETNDPDHPRNYYQLTWPGKED